MLLAQKQPSTGLHPRKIIAARHGCVHRFVRAWPLLSTWHSPTQARCPPGTYGGLEGGLGVQPALGFATLVTTARATENPSMRRDLPAQTSLLAHIWTGTKME